MKDRHEPGQPELDLSTLVDDIVAVQRPVADSAARLRRARSQLLVSARMPPVGRSFADMLRLRAFRWTAALTASAALTFALVSLRQPPPLTFEIGTPGVAAQLAAPLRARGDASLPVRFSDGSTFTAAPRSELSVTEVSPEGARVVLDDGAVAAEVVHRAKSRWHVQAGPYTVAVTGTRFAVEWDRRAQTFSLTLDEGGVSVFGPSFGTTGRRVSAHETVRVAPEPPRGVPPSSRTSEPSPFARASEPSMAARAPEPSSPPPPRHRGLASLESPSPRAWKDLAQGGRYADALAAAEAEGFAALCHRGSATELLLLGNAARFAQNPDRAEQAFRALRGKGDRPHERAVAAFELGRLAHDVGRRYRDAADWFGVYLREEPDGVLAREAAGRQLEALHRAGDVGAARRAAATFRSRYPDGPYQDLARQILGM